MFTDKGTKATWANPTVTPVSQRQNGGWYYNPDSGSVDRWFTNPPSAQNNTQTTSTPSSTTTSSTPSIVDTVKAQADATAAANAAQEKKINDWQTTYSNAVAGQETLPAMATRIGNTLGLPDLTKNAQNLTASVAAIPENQKNATRGFDVNSTQLANIIAAKSATLAPVAQEAVTQEQNAETNLATQLGYGVADQTKQLQPIITQGTMLSDQIAREMTGFTTDNENALNAILTDIKNEQTVSQADLDRANDLAKAQLQYTNAKTTLSPGQTVVDNTGKVIYTAPTSTSGTSTSSYYETPTKTTPTTVNNWS